MHIMGEMADLTPLPSLIDLRHHQLKDGRRLARLTAEEMAQRVGVSRRSIMKIESSDDGLATAAFGTIRKITLELIQAGIEFLPDGGVVRRGEPSDPPRPAGED
jgi:transcriptional regulator with XRE-family HTH domain